MSSKAVGLFPNKIKAAGPKVGFGAGSTITAAGSVVDRTALSKRNRVRVAADTPGLACRTDAASSIYPRHDKPAYQGVKKRRG
jgi:hypothetical protein